MFNFKKNQVQEEIITKELMQQKEVLIFHTLKGLLESGKVYSDVFLYNHVMGDVSVRAKIIKYEAGVIQIVFGLEHKYLLEPIVELISAFDKSFEDAIITAAKNYYDRILSVYITAIQSQSTIKVNSVLNEKHKYDLFRSKVYYVGKKKSDFENFLPYFQDILSKFVGNKRVYYLKVSVAYSNQELTCNVYIDGRLSPCLSDFILDQIEVKKAKKDWVEKQYFYLIQDVWSYDAYQFSIKEIQEHTIRAIKLFQKCYHAHDIDTVYELIEKKCKDATLATEIVGLIPELFCKYYHQKITFYDRVYLYRDNGGKKTVYASMMYTYPIIEACVFNYLNENKLNKEMITNVLRYSGTAQVIGALKKEKQNLQDLKIQGLPMNIKNQYVLR